MLILTKGSCRSWCVLSLAAAGASLSCTTRRQSSSCRELLLSLAGDQHTGQLCCSPTAGAAVVRGCCTHLQTVCLVGAVVCAEHAGGCPGDTPWHGVVCSGWMWVLTLLCHAVSPRGAGVVCAAAVPVLLTPGGDARCVSIGPGSKAERTTYVCLAWSWLPEHCPWRRPYALQPGGEGPQVAVCASVLF